MLYYLSIAFKDLPSDIQLIDYMAKQNQAQPITSASPAVAARQVLDADQVLAYVKENVSAASQREMALYLNCSKEDVRMLMRFLGIEGKAGLTPEFTTPARAGAQVVPPRGVEPEILTFLKENAGSLSVRAMADKLGFSTSYVYQLLRWAKIPASTFRNRDREEKAAYIREQFGKKPAVEICQFLGISKAYFRTLVNREGVDRK